MSSNPFPEERTEVIEELQPRPPVPQTPTSQPQAVYPVAPGAGVGAPPQLADADVGEAQNREDALTIKFAIGKLNDYLQWFLMVLESILAIRFLLKMFGADPGNLFASFIFTLTDILLVPFNNILPNVSLHVNQAFEFSTLFAAAIYFLIFFALKRFLRILISSPEEPVE
ncbi:MAG TPA: YggT family protein [Ktedonobacteraceae bacterium]|nr:YggT family protein [Ktedonobacteraceae bacterium]